MNQYNDSNYTLRFPRSYKEATGQKIRGWHFQPTPDQGDKAVGIACMVIAILLPLASYVFNWHIGG